MLAELAVFNAAVAVVKETVAHSGDIVNCFKSIGEAMSARQKIEAAVKTGDGQSDLELYAAHVQAEEQWKEVKQLLVYSGHWHAYENFVADRRASEKERKRIARQEEAKRKQLWMDGSIIVGAIITTIMVIGAFLWAIGEFQK